MSRSRYDETLCTGILNNFLFSLPIFGLIIHHDLRIVKEFSPLRSAHRLTGAKGCFSLCVAERQPLQVPSPAAHLLCCIPTDRKRGALLAAGRIVVCRMSLQGRTPAARLVCCNAVDIKRGAFATGRLRRLQRRKVGVWVPIVCRVGYAEGNECGYVRDEHRARITRHNASGCLSPTTRQNATGARPCCVYARLFVLMVK